MTPIDDPRPFAEVLRDWRARLGVTYERQARAHMTLIDEGRTP